MSNVLIIEDDDWCVRCIENAIDGLCDHPLVTGKLSEAYMLLGEDTDLVWLDLSLKDSGIDQTIDEGIPKIRELAPNAALVAASGYGEFYRARVLKAGADAYTDKNDLMAFDRARVSALILTGAQRALERGVDANRILDRVAKIFKP